MYTEYQIPNTGIPRMLNAVSIFNIHIPPASWKLNEMEMGVYVQFSSSSSRHQQKITETGTIQQQQSMLLNFSVCRSTSVHRSRSSQVLFSFIHRGIFFILIGKLVPCAFFSVIFFFLLLFQKKKKRRKTQRTKSQFESFDKLVWYYTDCEGFFGCFSRSFISVIRLACVCVSLCLWIWAHFYFRFWHFFFFYCCCFSI